MKLFSTLTVTAIAAVSTALSAAEVIDMSKKEFWIPVKGVEFTENQFVAKRAMFRSLKPIEIDTTKKYTISMNVSTGSCRGLQKAWSKKQVHSTTEFLPLPKPAEHV